MSYILDALRRADAERQRGGVPGLHDQTGAPVALGGAPGQPAADAARPLWWLAGAAGLVLALGAAWWLGRGGAAPAPGTAPMPGPLAGASAVPASMPAAAAQVPAPEVAPGGQGSVAVPASPPLLAVVQPPQAPVIAPPRPPAVPVAPAAAPVQRPAGPTAPVGAPAKRQVPAAKAAAETPAPAASDPVRSWASLPESARALLPPLAWSGAVYAERAQARLVVVNGQVAREGDTLAPDVQLLQIRPKSVVVRWLGQRVELPL